MFFAAAKQKEVAERRDIADRAKFDAAMAKLEEEEKHRAKALEKKKAEAAARKLANEEKKRLERETKHLVVEQKKIRAYVTRKMSKQPNTLACIVDRHAVRTDGTCLTHQPPSFSNCRRRHQPPRQCPGRATVSLSRPCPGGGLVGGWQSLELSNDDMVLLWTDKEEELGDEDEVCFSERSGK
ncbi:hypothetical protein ZWY2020_049500 [Hordeum vulgare]|nr:hypothetical protein ZWY2020_049500 [Hordeum vulgare]